MTRKNSVNKIQIQEALDKEQKILRAAYFRNTIAVISVILQLVTTLILIHKL